MTLRPEVRAVNVGANEEGRTAWMHRDEGQLLYLFNS